MKKYAGSLILIALLFCQQTPALSGGFIGYEPEVIANAEKAIGQNDVSYALKLVKDKDKKEIQDAFNLAMQVRVLSPEARQLADTYFLATLARVHEGYDKSFPWLLSCLFFITSVCFAILYFKSRHKTSERVKVVTH